LYKSGNKSLYFNRDSTFVYFINAGLLSKKINGKYYKVNNKIYLLDLPKGVRIRVDYDNNVGLNRQIRLVDFSKYDYDIIDTISVVINDTIELKLSKYDSVITYNKPIDNIYCIIYIKNNLFLNYKSKIITNKEFIKNNINNIKIESDFENAKIFYNMIPNDTVFISSKGKLLFNSGQYITSPTRPSMVGDKKNKN
jgi:hypothetical protein